MISKNGLSRFAGTLIDVQSGKVTQSIRKTGLFTLQKRRPWIRMYFETLDPDPHKLDADPKLWSSAFVSPPCWRLGTQHSLIVPRKPGLSLLRNWEMPTLSSLLPVVDIIISERVSLVRRPCSVSKITTHVRQVYIYSQGELNMDEEWLVCHLFGCGLHILSLQSLESALKKIC